MPGTAERDLASVELWQESLLRSQQRRAAAEARKDVTRKKTASVAVSAAVAASPMWPSVTATAADLSKEEAGKLARKLEKKDGARVLLEYGDTDSRSPSSSGRSGSPTTASSGPTRGRQ